MKVGIIGTRGIPNNYGGFEKLAERLSAGMVAAGHQVAVYNSHNHVYKGRDWNGVQIIRAYDPEFIIGTAGQFLYDLNCILDSRRRGFDVILNLGYTSSAIWMPAFPHRALLVTNMDGFEWKRNKFSPMVKRFLKYSEKLAVKGSDAMVLDSKFIQGYFADTYGVMPHYIAYGADLFDEPDAVMLQRTGASPFGYNMLVARMEPENNIGMLLDGVRLSKSPLPFYVVGQNTNAYARKLMHDYAADKRIVFCGPIYKEKEINNLRYHSNLYFHGHSVGGTNPSLLEAMGCKALIMAHDNAFNRSVLRTEAGYFRHADDVAALLDSEGRQSPMAASWVEKNYGKIRSEFSWPLVIAQYIELFDILLQSRSARR